jgi:hypothetical protein
MSTERYAGPLRERTCTELANLMRLVHAGIPVEWVDDQDVQRTGTLRHLADDEASAAYARADQDIRHTFVRITLVGGWERWERTVDMARWLATGSMAER